MLRKLLGELAQLRIQAQGSDAGKIEDVYFDDHEWIVRYFVVNTGSWLLGRRVLVSPVAVAAPDWANHVLRVKLTKEQVESSPDIDLERPVSRQQLFELHQYYGWPMFGDADPMLGTSFMGLYPSIWAAREQQAEEAAQTKNRAAQSAEAPANQEPGDRHLRSAHEVKGYHIHAADGEFGYVEDFFVSESDWFVRYLLIDSHRWLPGRKFLIAPPWIDAIDWPQSEVKITKTREQIEHSPEYIPQQAIQRDYETKLYRHYEAPGYWLNQPDEPSNSVSAEPTDKVKPR
jgi:hypothetical protein